MLVRLLVGVAILGLTAVLGLTAITGWLWSRADVSTIGQLSFSNPLKIPPLLHPRVDGTGQKVFELRLQQGASELLPGKPTETWGVNGAYLGPTLRVARGDRVAMQVTNNLPEPTTIHWHGMHLPAAADGGPHQVIEPGATWTPSWTVDQPAATLWYHPHPHGVTDRHAYRGLSGLVLLDDPQASGLPLPYRYGIDDIPVVVQDKRFDDEGNLELGNQPFDLAGRLGSQILINGTYDPHLAVTTQRVRLRLLNASTARTYNFGFTDDRAFDMIATDGGLLEHTHPTTRIPLSPGERAEVVVTFQPGERVVLRSFKPDLGMNFVQRRFAG
ncbi:MAG TPA: multicopper oxidase domain-containing protein, partial [Jiangellaceae bacterium]